jgi:hypothetical protein
MLHDRDRDLFLQAHAAVAAGRAVDLNEAFVQFVGNFGARNGGCAAGDFYYVAGSSANTLHVCRGETRDGAPHILHACFRDAQSERGRR